ncbi:MAG: hypothetical protein K2J70_00330 [Muribaculaceae bacterium]|nr:hypothetical protein [Muribaculaceae bacterium]
MEIKKYEEDIHEDLHRFLVGVGMMDEKMPECPDLDELWPSIETAYLPDGIREFTDYPLVSMGWVMFIGMALAKYWDEDWIKYSEEGGERIYHRLRDAKGYDNLDDYILKDVLELPEEEAEKVSSVVGECAARVLSSLHRSGIEPSTEKALRAYKASLHQLYIMGVAMELNALGYHMTAIG